MMYRSLNKTKIRQQLPSMSTVYQLLEKQRKSLLTYCHISTGKLQILFCTTTVQIL